MLKSRIIFCFWVFISGIAILKGQNGVVVIGGLATGSGGIVSFSIGQVDYLTTLGSNGIMTQGLQQPHEIFNVGIDEYVKNLNISLYPNPATNFVFLKTDETVIHNLYYALFDLNGKLIDGQSINSKQIEIDVHRLNSGMYFIKLMNGNQTLKIVKL